MKWFRLLSITLLFAGCRQVPDDEDPQGNTGGSRPDAAVPRPDGGSAAMAGTVKAILQSPPASKAPVSVTGAVVVGRVTSSKNAYVWIQDPGGGARSGIQVFCQKDSCAAGYDIIDKLEEGDVIDVSGNYDVFMGAAEIVTPTVVKKGTKKAVAATTVTAAQVAHDGDSGAAAFVQLNQVLVKLDKPVTVTSINPASMERDCTSGTGKQYDGFEVEVDGKTVNVGLGFYDTVGWCITSCGFECKKPLTVGAKFEGLQGVLRVVSGNIRIDPPWEADLLTEAGPAPDGGPSSDADAGPGAPDGGGGGPVGDGTVRSITSHPPADGSAVSLAHVVVVGVETGSSSASVYVQDPGGGPRSGMLLFCGAACKAELAGLSPGDVIDATGTFKLFSGNTPELTDVDATPLGTRTDVVALSVTAADLAKTLAPTSAAFGPLNGVLVDVAGPLFVSSVDVPALQSSSTCTGGARFRDGFEASVLGTGVYVTFFFNDNVSSCVAGGCRTCDVGPIQPAQKLDFLRGVARVHKGQGDPVVVVSPVDEIDFPRARSIRSIFAAGPADGTSVAVDGAVVVAYNALADNKGSLFLQDAGGGRYSGIQLFCTTTTCNNAAKALVPGDAVNVSGKFLRYLGNTPEIDATAAPAKVGASKALPMTVAGIGADMATIAEAADFQPYNQVYVKVAGSLAVANLTPSDLQASCTGSDLPRYEGFQVNDGAFDYLVSDLFAPAYTLCVAGGCDECRNPVAADGTFSSVSGVARVGRGGKVQIAPTSDADLAP